MNQPWCYTSSQMIITQPIFWRRSGVFKIRIDYIMVNIHKSCKEASEKYGFGYNLVAGANIAGFLKVANAMIEQGIV